MTRGIHRAVTHIRLLANCATPPRRRRASGLAPLINSRLTPRGRTVTDKGYGHIGLPVRDRTQTGATRPGGDQPKLI